ncbi:hypothetical protein B0H11DRAFT_2351022 [Mycena galericulata]|nr:hypothetical protein B0H11DRAFT_2351022 [Mycena galericulata]
MFLFEELTTVPGEPYPVTAILRELLGVVALDACQTTRNVHSTYLVVSRARDVCEKIHTLAATAGDGDSLDNFKAYSRMITSLEGILLDFEPLSWKESNAETLPTAETIKEDLQFIDDWRDNRTALREMDGSPSEAEVKATYKHDDVALLATLSESLSDLAQSLSGIAKENVGKIQKQLNVIQATFVTATEDLPNVRESCSQDLNQLTEESYQDVVAYAIQAAMVIEVVASARDSRLAPRRDSREMWTRAASLMDVIERYSKKASLPLGPLKAAWDEFRAYLLARAAPSQFPPAIADGKPSGRAAPASSQPNPPARSHVSPKATSTSAPSSFPPTGPEREALAHSESHAPSSAAITAKDPQPKAPATSNLSPAVNPESNIPPSRHHGAPKDAQTKAPASSGSVAPANSTPSTQNDAQPKALGGSKLSSPPSLGSGTVAADASPSSKSRESGSAQTGSATSSQPTGPANGKPSLPASSQASAPGDAHTRALPSSTGFTTPASSIPTPPASSGANTPPTSPPTTPASLQPKAQGSSKLSEPTTRAPIATDSETKPGTGTGPTQPGSSNSTAPTTPGSRPDALKPASKTGKLSGSKPSIAAGDNPDPKASALGGSGPDAAAKLGADAGSQPSASLPAEYFELRRLALEILRPHYGQSLALIDGCFELAVLFDAKKIEMLNPFQTALRDTTKALKAAAEVAYDPSASFKYPTVSPPFDKARASIKHCFTVYKVGIYPSGPASAPPGPVREGKGAFTPLNHLIRSMISPPSQPRTELSVTITESGAPTTKTYLVESSTTLNTVLWKASREIAQEQVARNMQTKGYFEARNKRLGIDTQVGDISVLGGRAKAAEADYRIYFLRIVYHAPTGIEKWSGSRITVHKFLGRADDPQSNPRVEPQRKSKRIGWKEERKDTFFARVAEPRVERTPARAHIPAEENYRMVLVTRVPGTTTSSGRTESGITSGANGRVAKPEADAEMRPHGWKYQNTERQGGYLLKRSGKKKKDQWDRPGQARWEACKEERGFGSAENDAIVASEPRRPIISATSSSPPLRALVPHNTPRVRPASVGGVRGSSVLN